MILKCTSPIGGKTLIINTANICTLLETNIAGLNCIQINTNMCLYENKECNSKYILEKLVAYMTSSTPMNDKYFTVLYSGR